MDIVLTETSANRLFGSVDQAMNSMMKISGNTFHVSAVIKDLPDNTHISFTAYTRHESLPEGAKASGTNFFTYLKLQKDTDLNALQANLDAMIQQHVAQNPLYANIMMKQNISLISLADIHLHSNLIWEMKDNGSYRDVLLFSFLGGFILLMAVINYVNLATARSTLRSREIGMRKVIGASRKGLFEQIIIESLLVTLISFILAIAFTEIAAGFFSGILGVSLSTAVFLTPAGLLLILMVFIITALMAGLYPGFYLSSFNAIKVLKGEMVKGRKGKFLRQILVVLQFAITIFIVSSLIVINRQMNHMQNYNLGFEQQQVVLVRNLSSPIYRSFPEMRARLEQLSRIESAAGANFIYGGSNRVDLIREQGMSSETGVVVDFLTVDDRFLDVLRIDILQGRNFFSDSETDINEALILNQSAVKALGFEEPLEKNLQHFVYTAKLIGVIKDFHIKSLHQEINPLVLMFAQRGFPHIYMRVNPGSFEELTSDISRVMNQFDPFLYSRYHFHGRTNPESLSEGA
jgi:putative ABC transport system permease protein